MEALVYDIAINERGTVAGLLNGSSALLPVGYYTLTVPALLKQDRHALTAARRAELDKFGAACRARPELRNVVQSLFDSMLPKSTEEESGGGQLQALLEKHGFDRAQHEEIRTDLKHGRIGLAQNRLRANVLVEDVQLGDVTDARGWTSDATQVIPGTPELSMSDFRNIGSDALRKGELAVVTLAAGAGSRWTQGAGVVKALHPFCKLAGKHRTFLEVHLAKTRRVAGKSGAPLPHVFTTGYLTHEPTAEFLQREKNYGFKGPLHLSPGRSVGLRMVPTVRDLRFAWEELPQQILDEQQQKLRDSLRHALIQWALAAGEAADYTDNLPIQCLHPVGHWYEIPNMFRNGVLKQLLTDSPNLKHILLHNIDTLGADVDTALLGWHIHSGSCLSFEVINRRLEDRGGGLARVNGQVRLVEGLSMPREEAEFALSYYNSNTCWIDLDQLLKTFGLSRQDILRGDAELISNAIRGLASRMPTYITIKDVKKRWGHGQEDVFPVTQFEKLWVDMTRLPDVPCGFVVVPRLRGQQLKDPAQLDGWLRDGSAAYVESLGDWG
jgi:hypothetical protein